MLPSPSLGRLVVGILIAAVALRDRIDGLGRWGGRRRGRRTGRRGYRRSLVMMVRAGRVMMVRPGRRAGLVRQRRRLMVHRRGRLRRLRVRCHRGAAACGHGRERREPGRRSDERE